MIVKSTLVIGAVAATAVLGCQPPNCDRVDFGSCGNACCKVRVNHPSADPVEVKTVIEKLMLSGGPDSRYKMQPTAEAPNVDGFADLRPFNVTAQFQGLATHTTLSGTYTDNVYMTVYPGYTIMHSISLIGGAFGDAGQNYKNLHNIFTSIPVSITTVDTLLGCPVPSA
eukprot:TRINITY_DN880_c0_g1_i2.p1 TRINITY_DN880_c0_g1~~TRINITY_DN880_c0_g1_i2.p1  ORF type:complete len:193 (-),score=105.82 TRINITY_DN880_c0_g1_i2:55-561(-)